MVEEVFLNSWDSNSNANIVRKLEFYVVDLDKWGKKLKSKFRSNIESCKRNLEELREKRDPDFVATFNKLKDELTNLLVQEEGFWKKRSKIFWLYEGYQNTKFFHTSASSTKRQNKLCPLTNEDGTIVTAQRELTNLAKEYFGNLFTHQDCELGNVIFVIPNFITDEDNGYLIAHFIVAKFKEALMEMDPNKSLGPDNLNSVFHRRFWDIYGQEVVDACTSWLESGNMP